MTLTLGCASLDHVHEDYQDQVEVKDAHSNQRTVIFFLVDGFPLRTAKTQIEKGHLPEIQNYFLNKSPLYQARVPFPSLTYPGISSLLTETPVHQHGVFGNTVVIDGAPLNFEVPSTYAKLNAMLEGKTIFSRLKEKNLFSVSFDYSFLSDATAHTRPTDSNVGLAILAEEYNIPDRRQLKGLENLLSNTETKKWPHFIFIHLVGLDFITHDYGPDSPQTVEYLRKLDSQLKPIFKLLKNAETKKERQIISMMSSDHGFDEPIHQRLDFETAVRRQDRKIFVLNEGRYAGIYFPETYTEKDRARFLRQWIENPNIDLVAVKEAQHVFIKSKTHELEFEYSPKTCKESSFGISVSHQTVICPEELTVATNNLFYPFFIQNLSFYFQAINRPDAIVIPKPGITFKEKIQGQHGGPTTNEVFVPLLMRGANLGDPTKIPALWELLRFL